MAKEPDAYDTPKRSWAHLLATCACAPCATIPVNPPEVEGRVVDPEWAMALRRQGQKVTVTLDGQDVTDDCFLAGEGKAGFVYCLIRNDDRRSSLCPEVGPAEHVCAEMRTGHVVVQPQT